MCPCLICICQETKSLVFWKARCCRSFRRSETELHQNKMVRGSLCLAVQRKIWELNWMRLGDRWTISEQQDWICTQVLNAGTVTIIHLHSTPRDSSFSGVPRQQKWQIGNMEKFERIQRSTTKMIKGLDYRFWVKMLKYLGHCWRDEQ